MSIIAFNFTKISAERKAASNAKHQVQNKTAISDIKEVALGKQKALSFIFTQETNFSPNLGSIVMEGNVLVLSNEEEAKQTIESFQKTKRFAAPLTEKVYNTILQRTSIQSLIMARDIGLPPPLQLPRITAAAKTAPVAAPAKAAATPEVKPKKK